MWLCREGGHMSRDHEIFPIKKGAPVAIMPGQRLASRRPAQLGKQRQGRYRYPLLLRPPSKHEDAERV
jgi:hypothetical protein